VKDGTGKLVEEKKWPAGSPLDHEGLLMPSFPGAAECSTGSDRIVAVGHRVVHGGLEYTKPTIVNDHILGDLEKFVPLAPLHQPHNLAAIRIVARRNPGMPQVACFRHLLSHEHLQPGPGLCPAAEIYRARGPGAMVSTALLRVHLYGPAGGRPGGGKRQNGRCTPRKRCKHVRHERLEELGLHAGFTAVEGLMMGTRCGTLDPGVMLYLMDECGMNTRDLEKLIYKESGLLGVSGFRATCGRCWKARTAGRRSGGALRLPHHPRAWVARLGSRGLDALVFTGGIGENAAPIRERVCRAAQWLGLDFEEKANAGEGPASAGREAGYAPG